jgi:transcriptional regulator with XRE-family HTH domain
MKATTGQAIKAMRALRGMRQQDLANAMGVHQSLISHIETGYWSPSDEYLARIAQAMGVSITDIKALKGDRNGSASP